MAPPHVVKPNDFWEDSDAFGFKVCAAVERSLHVPIAIFSNAHRLGHSDVVSGLHVAPGLLFESAGSKQS